MRLKKTVKGFVAFVKESGEDLVRDEMPVEVLEEMLRTHDQISEDGPEGWEVRVGDFCFPRTLFLKSKS